MRSSGCARNSASLDKRQHHKRDEGAMKNKKKVEEAILAVAFHMNQCAACIESLLKAGDSKADPVCAEYQRLKAAAKTLAGR